MAEWVRVDSAMLKEFADTITELRRQNSQLRARTLKLERARDHWREKAKLYRRRHEELLGKRTQREKQPVQRYTAKQWRTHYKILDRIRSL